MISRFTKEAITNVISENLVDTTKYSTDILSNWIKTRIDEVETYARNPIIKTMNIESIIPYIKEEKKLKDGIYAVLFVSDLKGNYYSQSITKNKSNLDNNGKIIGLMGGV